MAYPRAGEAGASLRAMVAQPLKQAITGQVVALFNDASRGEKPVVRRPDGLFGRRSVAWRVHGDVTSMMVGGVAGLMLQMLHPAVLAGVWDHSKFRNDMAGRLRRTARFIALTTYGGRDEALAAIARVRRIHDAVEGVLPDGTPYRANDPAALAWVHVTETTSFLDAWVRYAEPGMRLADRDQYFREMEVVGRALGAAALPKSLAEARAALLAGRPSLRCDDRTREVARLVMVQPAKTRLEERLQRLTIDAGVDLLPDWARRLHGLPEPMLGPAGRPLVRAGMLGIARTLRWAFA